MPHDPGFNIPRQKKTADFVGDRSLHTENANRADRKQHVGLMVLADAAALLGESHAAVVGENARLSLC